MTFSCRVRFVMPIALGLSVLSLHLASWGCERVPANRSEQERYVVTAAPIDIGITPRLCVAVEPANPKGVWWWQPGPTGCATRSTGPSVFEGQEASVRFTNPDRIEVRFRVPLHRAAATQPDAVDVVLILEDGHLSVAATQSRVATERRRTLDIPERT